MPETTMRGLLTIAMLGASALVLTASLTAADTSSTAGSGDARIVHVQGTDIVLKLWEQGGSASYAISFDGRRFSEPQATSYELKLRHGEFDPLTADPDPTIIDPALESGADTNLYIVQFVTQIEVEGHFPHDEDIEIQFGKQITTRKKVVTVVQSDLYVVCAAKVSPEPIGRSEDITGF